MSEFWGWKRSSWQMTHNPDKVREERVELLVLIIINIIVIIIFIIIIIIT